MAVQQNMACESGKRVIVVEYPNPPHLSCCWCVRSPAYTEYAPKKGYFVGQRRVEDLAKHLKIHHPDQFTLVYKCRECGHTGDGKYPRRVVTMHYKKVHGSPPPDLAPRRALKTTTTSVSLVSVISPASQCGSGTIATLRSGGSPRMGEGSDDRVAPVATSCSSYASTVSENAQGGAAAATSGPRKSAGSAYPPLAKCKPRIVNVEVRGPGQPPILGHLKLRKTTAPTNINVNAGTAPAPPRTTIRAATSSPPTTTTSKAATRIRPAAAAPTTILKGAAAVSTRRSEQVETAKLGKRLSAGAEKIPERTCRKTPPVPRRPSKEGPTTTKEGSGAARRSGPSPNVGKGPAPGKKCPSPGTAKRVPPVRSGKTPVINRRVSLCPPAPRRITRAMTSATRMQGGGEPSLKDITTSARRRTGDATRRRSSITGALIPVRSPLGETPRLRSTARARGGRLPLSYAEATAGLPLNTPTNTLGGCRIQGGATPSSSPITSTSGLATLSTVTLTTSVCGGSRTSPGATPPFSWGTIISAPLISGPAPTAVSAAAATTTTTTATTTLAAAGRAPPPRYVVQVPQGSCGAPPKPAVPSTSRRSAEAREEAPRTSAKTTRDGTPSTGAAGARRIAAGKRSPPKRRCSEDAVEVLGESGGWRTVPGKRPSKEAGENSYSFSYIVGGSLVNKSCTNSGGAEPDVRSNGSILSPNSFRALEGVADEDGARTFSSASIANGGEERTRPGPDRRRSAVPPAPTAAPAARAVSSGGRRSGGRGGRLGSRARPERQPSEEQTILVRRIESVSTVAELEEAANLVAAFFSSKVSGGQAPRPIVQNPRTQTGRREAQLDSRPAAPSSGEGRIREATRVQKLYRSNRRRAVREILDGAARPCPVGKERVAEYYRDVHRARETAHELPPVFDDAPPSDASSGALVAPLTRAEVSRRLWRMSNSSPGPDGLTYRDLREADQGCQVMTAMFNACIRLEAVPSRWKNSTTVLLHKKGERDQLENWRPIALGDTTPKLFAAVFADRLTAWARANSVLSASQKGFLPFEGCVEHNYILSEILMDAERKGKEVVVSWLDLANAFGSIPHGTIRDALRLLQVPATARNLVNSFYTGATTKVRACDGLTGPVPILSGVRQGCPLSPIIFNLSFEAIVRTLDRSKEGVEMWGRRYTTLVYADDIAVVASSGAGMGRLLSAAEEAASRMGLAFNPKKCATLHLTGKGRRRVTPTPFFIGGERVRTLEEGEAYEHLGIPTGFKVRQTPITSIEDIVKDVRAVDRSLLAPWQKLDAVATFVLPRLDFALGGCRVDKGPLKAADAVVKRLAKGWLHLPQRASAEMVVLPPREGGGGLIPLAEYADVLAVAHAFKILTSGDTGVRENAWCSLQDAASRRIRREATPSEMFRFLSGDISGEFKSITGDPPSVWKRARDAARRQSEKLGIRWTWSEDLGEFSLECRGRSGKIIRIPPSARIQAVGRLRAAVIDWHRERLLKKPDQGKVFEVSSRCQVSNHFLRDGRNTRFADWRFLHRARLGVLPLNGTRRWGEGDRRCRRCGDTSETIPHVLNHCGPHSDAIQKRHNALLDRLAGATRLPGEVRKNQHVEGVHELFKNLRPDLVIRNELEKKIVIVDVAVPFENRLEAFDEARGRKMSKYLPLAEDLKGRGYSVEVGAFIVGALGSWDQKNERTISLLNINPFYAKMMRRLMVSDTIRWSRDIYVEHVSGIRQYSSTSETPSCVNEQNCTNVECVCE